MLTEKDREFLAEHYATYYKTSFEQNYYLTDAGYREFAFEYWLDEPGRPSFQRHRDFPRKKLFFDYVKDLTPRHIYVSAAHYALPGEPSMRTKGWKDNRETNCDLIFDLDVDHIPTPCKKEHDKWICTVCGQEGRGMPPQVCSRVGCESTSFKTITWECPKCMEIVKQQTIFLAEDYLKRDFGIDIHNPAELFFTFSGRRGYHIHVEKERFRYLSSMARREIVDYITGVGLDPEVHGIVPRGGGLPKRSDAGWRGRIVRFTIRYMQEASNAELRKFFRRRIKEIPHLRKQILQDLTSENPTWKHKGVGKRTLYRIIKTAIAKYTPKIDKPVTVDTHRLIRLPGSLHGKTGFLVKKLSFTELLKFNPYTDAQVFKGKMRVFVYEVPQFTIEGIEWGPYKNQAVVVPLNVAIFLLSREVATISK